VAYVEDLVGYTGEVYYKSFDFDNVQSMLPKLFDEFENAGWDVTINSSQYIFTSRQVPWLPDINSVPAYYKGKIKIIATYDVFNDRLLFQVSDSTGTMVMQAGTFKSYIRFKPISGKFTIILNPYQIFMYNHELYGEYDGAYIGALQVPAWLQTYLQEIDCIFACEYDLRYQLFARNNVFCALNSVTGGAVCWNDGLLSGPGVPAIHTIYNAYWQQPLTFSHQLPIAIPPFVSWGTDNPWFDNAKIKGFLWDAIVLPKAGLTRDSVMTFDGHSWKVFSTSSAGALVVAIN